MTHPLLAERIWFDKWRVEEAENNFYARKSGCNPTQTSVVSEIKNIKDYIRGALRGESATADLDAAAMERIQSLEKENKALLSLIEKLEQRVVALEIRGGGDTAATPAAKPAPAGKDEEDDDDDIDLFGSDEEEEDEETKRIKEERLAAYAAKKAKKPTVIAKSNIIFDVKPWDDETDMVKMEKSIRTIAMDGLLWGSSKLEPVGYGIKKLVISCVVEDDKVGTDDLEEAITAFEDYVQSVDIAAFNKI